MLIKIKIVLSLYAIECTVLQWWTFERQQQYISHTATTIKQSPFNTPSCQDGPVLRRAMGPPPDAPAGLGGLPPPQRRHRAPALLQVWYLQISTCVYNIYWNIVFINVKLNTSTVAGSRPWTGLRRICGGRRATIPCSSSCRRLPHIFSFQLLRWGFHQKSVALVHIMTHFVCRMQKEKSFTMRREDCAISDSSSLYSRYCFWTTNILWARETIFYIQILWFNMWKILFSRVKANAIILNSIVSLETWRRMELKKNWGIKLWCVMPVVSYPYRVRWWSPRGTRRRRCSTTRSASRWGCPCTSWTRWPTRTPRSSSSGATSSTWPRPPWRSGTRRARSPRCEQINQYYSWFK